MIKDIRLVEKTTDSPSVIYIIDDLFISHLKKEIYINRNDGYYGDRIMLLADVIEKYFFPRNSDIVRHLAAQFDKTLYSKIEFLD